MTYVTIISHLGETSSPKSKKEKEKKFKIK